MIIAIDGPAGAGKSSISKRLAQELSFNFLDTGAMYRVVTLACLRAEIDLSNETAIAACAAACSIQLDAEKVYLNGENVSDLIRTPEISRSIRAIADNQGVRQQLVRQQREIVGQRDFVTEGRDQGTVAFPNADCKIFLTASPIERASRRQAQLAMAGIHMELEAILADQDQRDAEDTTRVHGNLAVASDAIYVHTDGMQEDEVVQRLVEIVQGHSRT